MRRWTWAASDIVPSRWRLHRLPSPCGPLEKSVLLGSKNFENLSKRNKQQRLEPKWLEPKWPVRASPLIRARVVQSDISTHVGTALWHRHLADNSFNVHLKVQFPQLSCQGTFQRTVQSTSTLPLVCKQTMIRRLIYASSAHTTSITSAPSRNHVTHSYLHAPHTLPPSSLSAGDVGSFSLSAYPSRDRCPPLHRSQHRQCVDVLHGRLQTR